MCKAETKQQLLGKEVIYMSFNTTGIQRKNNNAALYMRLSKEDVDSFESASIENQRKILRAYARDNGIDIYDEYIDDGCTGTNMERPELNRMKADIENGKIGVVITKDFSRLGRNSGQVMTMLDDYFVKHHVQYIAVSEGIDTMCDGAVGIITPVLSFTNEMYAGDISRKIRSSLKIKMKNGEYIGAFPPYGYKKDFEDKNRLVIDRDSSMVVKQIFDYAADGHSPKQIAEILNSKKILTPSLYRYKVNTHLSKNAFNRSDSWTAGTIGKILRNEVYLGHTLQGKTVKPSFKSKKCYSVPKDDWIKIENTHEAIISEETWEIVRKKMQSRAQKREKGFINIFSGIAKCADCGKNMSSSPTRKKGARANLNCGGYKLGGTKKCTNHAIDYDVLYNTVSIALREQISFTEEERKQILDEMMKSVNTNKVKSEKAQKKLDTVENKLAQLFDSKYSGEIDNTTFEKLHMQYEREKAQLEEIVCRQEKTETVKNDVSEFKSQYERFSKLILEYENLPNLTPEILFKLIERIDVHQGKYINGVKHQQIDIYFKFRCNTK